MVKKRTINELRQTKEYTRNPWSLYGAPKIGSEGELETDDYEAEVNDESVSYYELIGKIKELRNKYPDDNEFGYHVAKELL